MDGIAGLAIIVGTVISAIIWIVIAWRAMRAHERIADAQEQIARKTDENNY